MTRPAAFLLACVFSAGLQAQPAANEQGQLDANETLFAVMAAVNAALPEPPATLAEHLAGRNIGVMSELRNFVSSHRKPDKTLDWSPYISLALSSGEPPDFKPNFTGLEEPPDLFQLEGFRNLLIRFYQEAGVDRRQSAVCRQRPIMSPSGPLRP